MTFDLNLFWETIQLKIVKYSFNHNIVTMKIRNKQLSRDLQNQILPMLIGLEEEGGEEEEYSCK